MWPVLSQEAKKEAVALEHVCHSLVIPQDTVKFITLHGFMVPPELPYLYSIVSFHSVLPDQQISLSIYLHPDKLLSSLPL